MNKRDLLKQLRDMGLPADLFTAGFAEREAIARAREQQLMDSLAEKLKADFYQHCDFKDQLESALAAWQAEMNSWHHLSTSPRPKWVSKLNHRSGQWYLVSSGKNKAAMAIRNKKRDVGHKPYTPRGTGRWHGLAPRDSKDGWFPRGKQPPKRPRI